MTDELFDQYMSEIDNSTVGTKRAGLSASIQAKRKNLQPHRAMLESMEDADSFRLSGQNADSRQIGFDSYEVYHPGKLQDQTVMPNGSTVAESTRRRLDRQKVRYAEEFGKPIASVEDGDIYEQGAREGLQSMYNISKDANTADWSPGDTSYYRDNEFTMGSKENPLNIPIDVVQDGKGTYGRHLTTAYNPNTNENVNLASENQYNTALYTPEGKFDKEATAYRRAGLAAGIKDPAPQKPFDSMSLQEQDAAMKAVLGTGGDRDGAVGEFADAAQSGAASFAGGVVNALIDGTARLAKDAGLGDIKSSKMLQSVEKYAEYYANTANSDKEFGVNTKLKAENQAAIDATWDRAWEDPSFDNIISAGTAVAKGLPHLLGQSVPEMAAMFTGLGFAGILAKRANDTSEEYSKNNNGEAMPYELVVGNMVANATLLKAEQILVKMGVKGGLKTLPAGKKQTFLKAVSKRTVGVVGSATGEYLQEGGEAVTDDWFSKPSKDQNFDGLIKSLQSSENHKQAFTGFVMGGALRGAGETTGFVVNDVKDVLKDKRVEREAIITGKSLDPKDAEFVALDAETDQATAEEVITQTETAKKQMSKAETIEDFAVIEDESAQKITQVARETATAETFENKPEVKAEYIDIIEGFVEQSKQEDLTGWDNIKTAVATAYKNAGIKDVDIATKTSQELLEGMTSQQLASLAQDPLFGSSVESFGIDTEMSGSVDYNTKAVKTVLQKGKKVLMGGKTSPGSYDYSLYKNKTGLEIKKRTDKLTQKSIPKKQKTTPIKASSVLNKSGITVSAIKTLLTGKLGSTRAFNKLSEYTTEKVTELAQDANTDPKVARIANKVLEARTKAAKAAFDPDVKNVGNTEITPDVVLDTKAGAIKFLKQRLKAPSLNHRGEAAEYTRLIQDALAKGFITEHQKDVLARRLARITKNTKTTKAEFDKEASEQKEAKDTGTAEETETEQTAQSGTGAAESTENGRDNGQPAEATSESIEVNAEANDSGTAQADVEFSEYTDAELEAAYNERCPGGK